MDWLKIVYDHPFATFFFLYGVAMIVEQVFKKCDCGGRCEKYGR
jgi:hypothetical protein